MTITTPILERFMRYVLPDPNSGCWLWGGRLDKHGYGRFYTKETVGKLAHRAAYELLVAPIPDGMTIDHSCWLRCCVNPQHLSLATASDNSKRQRSALKTHCVNGHAYSEDNTYKRPNGARDCRACIRERAAKYKAPEDKVPVKLTAEQVLDMRRRVDSGENQYDLAKDFGVTQSHVSRIATRKTWRHL